MVIPALAKLLNAMGKWCNLVEKHGIEDMYHPSNLGIISGLIEERRTA